MTAREGEAAGNGLSGLCIVEDDESVTVVWCDDQEQWVARFAKRGGFPARFWAERMVGLYDERGED